MWVVAIGDAFSGTTLIGPFDDWDTALKYGEEEYQSLDYTIVVIERP